MKAIMRRLPAIVLFLFVMAFFALPICAYAESPAAEQDTGAQDAIAQKTVRVGWYETPFNTIDQFGRRSGYAYEYQRKVAAYTGWTYEYVEGSWPELMQMLIDGKIDLMSDVSYKEDRADMMLYSSLPMGTESYFIFIAKDNSDIIPGHFDTLNGKTVGVTQGSFQEDLFISWADAHGVQVEIVELSGSETDSLKMLEDGRVDAFVTLNAYENPDSAIPFTKIGSSEFFFAVNKSRPDLLDELDVAMSRIQDENQYYNRELNEKHLSDASTSLYLNPDELAWLSKHGTIRVGYQDNYLAFCATDEKTGELTGALRDYLTYASTCLENAELNFEAVPYPTAAAALEALHNGEIDCMFPANLTAFDGEQIGLVMTPPLMRTEMDAVVREADQREFFRKNPVLVAVNEGNTNYEMWLLDNFPTWQIAYFKDTPTGLEGVAAGEADCVIISNYRFSNIAKQCEKLHLTTVYTGVDMDYFLAVREGDTTLYSILSRVTGIVPESVTHAALTYYSTEDVKLSFADFISENLAIILIVVVVALLAIIALLLRSIRAERKAREEEEQVAALSKRVFVDPLTSVRNKAGYDEYVQGMQDRMDAGEKFEFAMGVFDCDSLKEINDECGHDKGDLYLKTASQAICHVFDHSPVFRIGGDEFAVVLQGEDFENREERIAEFRQASDEINASAKNRWNEVHVSMGIVEFDPSTDRSAVDTARRADQLMYENKRLRKASR